jgi:Holliday junction resolvase-like predicted endonuclease
MVTDTRAAGGRWEREAEVYLHCQGLKTLARNFNCRVGEIDLVMEDGECLVFAEIRYRKNNRFGSGAETVTRSKQGRLAMKRADWPWNGFETRLPPIAGEMIIARPGQHELRSVCPLKLQSPSRRDPADNCKANASGLRQQG